MVGMWITFTFEWNNMAVPIKIHAYVFVLWGRWEEEVKLPIGTFRSLEVGFVARKGAKIVRLLEEQWYIHAGVSCHW